MAGEEHHLPSVLLISCPSFHDPSFSRCRTTRMSACVSQSANYAECLEFARGFGKNSNPIVIFECKLNCNNKNNRFDVARQGGYTLP